MKFYKTALATSLLVFSSMSYANSDRYFGVSIGNSEFDSGITTSTATLDEKDSNFKLLFGSQINESFAIELSYHDYGESSLSGATGDIFAIDGELLQFIQDGTIVVSVNSLAISGVLTHELTPSISALGRIGLSMWDAEMEVSTSSASASAEDDGTDLLYGLGLQARIGSNSWIRAEYEGHEDVELLNIGFITYF